ncbi:hypothetical protein K438DRAFT_1998626 [Mycena galopus ATCC 62051]|nr:hypothetical protein K438DRAFT_1998626 [Mycena galopus ATCC 62051]
MASDSSSTQPIALHFQNLVRVAGETIEGRVDLNERLARKDGIEQLRITMEGVSKTRIARQFGRVVVVHKQTVHLFSSSEMAQTLWNSKSEKTGLDVVSCPFRFTLPENLPSSFFYETGAAAIRYSLEVVADRPGLLHRNRRIRRVFPVMPAASESQLLARESLRQGWTGPWKVTTQDAQIRRGFWGDYSHVHATLSLPDLPSFPTSGFIPYTLHIVTDTKTLFRSDRPEKHGKPLFPEPPTRSSEVLQALVRKVDYTVTEAAGTHYKERRNETFDLQRGQIRTDNPSSSSMAGPTHTSHSQPEVHTIVDEPEWIPTDQDRGIWRRSVRFTSTLAFPFAPTCETETINWAYTLQFTIPFPGILYGNDLKLELPINLCPASACPPPPIRASGSSNLTYADVLPAGPPPMLDLPPAYWASETHDWDDEKDPGE